MFDFLVPIKGISRFCFFRISVFLLGIFLLAAIVYAQDYSLDYSFIGSGGEKSIVGEYSVYDFVNVLSSSGETQSSTDYQITDLTGLDDVTFSCIVDWALY